MAFTRVHVFRVRPRLELLSEVVHYCQEHGITSAVILGIIGSLESARINYLVKLPAVFESVVYTGPLEIVAAQGTVALKDKELILHIHLQVANRQVCTGGHIAEAKIFSTAEVTLAALDYQLQRQIDSYTGLNELVA